MMKNMRFFLYAGALALTLAYIGVCVCPAAANYFFRRSLFFSRRLSTNDLFSASHLLHRAIALDPMNAAYNYELGKVCSKMNTESYKLRAVQAYQKAVALNPTNAKYHGSLAWAYGRLAGREKQKMAHKEFELAIQLEPNNAWYHQVYAVWIFNHPGDANIEKAAAEYRKAITLNPKLADKALAEYFKIEKSYLQLKKILPDTPENHYKVMTMLLAAGLWEANEGDFRKDMETASCKYPYYKAMFRFYENKGDRNKGLDVLRAYLEIEPDCADAHFYIAHSLFYIQPVNWPEVFAHYERALTLAPENTFYRETYAWHLFYAKKYDEAIEELKKVVARDWWNVDIYRLLGDWYKSVGRSKEADAMYTEASRVSEYLKNEKKE